MYRDVPYPAKKYISLLTLSTSCNLSEILFICLQIYKSSKNSNHELLECSQDNLRQNESISVFIIDKEVESGTNLALFNFFFLVANYCMFQFFSFLTTLFYFFSLLHYLDVTVMILIISSS